VRLRRAELPSATRALARFLVGMLVVRERGGRLRVGRIVETEAYPPGDPASHAFRGPTPRNASMFLAPGHAYVYFVYGSCFMLNVSSEPQGVGAAVLVRALEPLVGLADMRRARGGARELTRGPGRLAEALALDRRQDGLDLCGAGELWLARGSRRGALACSVRIGISRALERRLRFYERGNAHVSGPGRLRT
jgi:DNA-3-methyladenine glycosylase